MGKEAPSRREQRSPDQNAPPHLLQTLTEVKVLHKLEVLVATHLMEHAGANEESLVAIVVTGESVADPVEPRDHAQGPFPLHEEVFEGTPHYTFVAKGAVDQLKGVCRREGIGVKEEQNLAAGNRSACVQEGGTG